MSGLVSEWLFVSAQFPSWPRLLVGVTATNACFPLFLTTTNCLDFLLLVAGPDRSATVPNHTYLRRELIVSSLCGCIDTETYCSMPRAIIHAELTFTLSIIATVSLFKNINAYAWRTGMQYSCNMILEYSRHLIKFECKLITVKWFYEVSQMSRGDNRVALKGCGLGGLSIEYFVEVYERWHPCGVRSTARIRHPPLTFACYEISTCGNSGIALLIWVRCVPVVVGTFYTLLKFCFYRHRVKHATAF